MRIHSDILTRADIVDAARVASVSPEKFEDHGSRSRDHAFNVTLSGESGRRAGFGASHEAASWDQWGIFISYLFEVDPRAIVGGYSSAAAFHYATVGRFDRECGPVLSTSSAAYRSTHHTWGWNGGTLQCSRVSHVINGISCGARWAR